MARGTTNTKASFAGGNSLPAATVDDEIKILASADDDATYELMKIEPPAGASLTNVNVAFAPLRDGPHVTGDPAARNVTVKPMRVGRSSADNAKPRDVFSGTIDTDTVVACATIAAAGKYGFDLLYAQLAAIDPTEPTKGAQITLLWAVPTYVVYANPAPFGAIPADTNTTWNVPLAYVRNRNDGAVISAEDIVEVGGEVVGAFVKDTQVQITTERTGHGCRRAYSDENNNPVNLAAGGVSKWVATAIAGVLSKTITPVVVGRRNVIKEEREIIIPPCLAATTQGTAGTGAAVVANLVLDNTRDWRKANFKFTAFVSGATTTEFAEDDPATANKNFPTMRDTVLATNSPVMYLNCGQSWVTTNPHAVAYDTRLWAGLIALAADVPGAGIINGVSDPGYLVADDGWGVYVDGTTGALTWYAKRAGAGAGPAVWMLLEAWFGQHP